MRQIKDTKGWAIVDENGIIDMKTVYATRRGAIVNWIVIKGIMVTAGWSDKLIFDTWEQMCGPACVLVIEVIISPLSSAEIVG